MEVEAFREEEEEEEGGGFEEEQKKKKHFDKERNITLSQGIFLAGWEEIWKPLKESFLPESRQNSRDRSVSRLGEQRGRRGGGLPRAPLARHCWNAFCSSSNFSYSYVTYKNQKKPLTRSRTL